MVNNHATEVKDVPTEENCAHPQARTIRSIWPVWAALIVLACTFGFWPWKQFSATFTLQQAYTYEAAQSILFFIMGALLVVAGFKMDRLVCLENRWFTFFADTVKRKREALEAYQAKGEVGGE